MPALQKRLTFSLSEVDHALKMVYSDVFVRGAFQHALPNRIGEHYFHEEELPYVEYIGALP